MMRKITENQCMYAIWCVCVQVKTSVIIGFFCCWIQVYITTKKVTSNCYCQSKMVLLLLYGWILFCFFFWKLALKLFSVCVFIIPIECNWEKHTYRHTWQPNDFNKTKQKKNDNLVMMIIHTSFDRWSFFYDDNDNVHGLWSLMMPFSFYFQI